MTEEDLRTLLQEVRLRETSIEDAVGQLKRGPFKTSAMREATPDHHRRLRHGLCEVILGSSKTLEQIISIARELSGQGAPVLITRLDDEKIAGLRKAFPACSGQWSGAHRHSQCPEDCRTRRPAPERGDRDGGHRGPPSRRGGRRSLRSHGYSLYRDSRRGSGRTSSNTRQNGGA